MSVFAVESMMSAFGYPMDYLVQLLLRAATTIPYLLYDDLDQSA